MTALSINQDERVYLPRVYLVLTAWFFTALALSLAGAFNATIGALPMTLIAGIGAPLLAFGLVYRGSMEFRRFIASLDIRPLILLHTWRMLGLGFVYLAVYEVLSPVFALPAGFGDAAAAVGALVLGVALYQGHSVRLQSVYLWNLFGLLDFVVAISLGILARPGMEVFDEVATSAPMGHFPLALIPGFVVPFFILTHWVIFLNTRQQMQRYTGKD